MPLRDYQQRAFDATVDWMKQSAESCVIEAATGAGKSWIIAYIADWLKQKSDKKVLCLAPSRELVLQNHEKFVCTGHDASIYSASIGKSMRHQVVFGTPLTVKNEVENFHQPFSAVVIDECHGITPTIKYIIDVLKRQNPHLRIIGLSATPFRMGTGYIYQYDLDNNPLPEEVAIEPYFNKLVCQITAWELIEQGYLTRPSSEIAHAESYATRDLQLNKMGQFDQKQVADVFERDERLTATIVRDIVQLSHDRKGVIIFAATVKHAEEVLETLPDDESRLVTGSTSKKEREQILKLFKAQRIKYLVNVAVLTTGFDAPHIDVVALLRATESASLLQQIIGRGLRLDDGKEDCLVLDYAGNIERHCPNGDIFDPTITARKRTGSSSAEFVCPSCSSVNEFGLRHNPDQLEIDDQGYFLDLAGNRIEVDEGVHMPAHFGRRCMGQSILQGFSHRCEYRWAAKECEKCGHENDIAARHCEKCENELINPNDKLSLEFKRITNDPKLGQVASVANWTCRAYTSNAGNETALVTFHTNLGKVMVWYTNKYKPVWDVACQAFWGGVAPSVAAFISNFDRAKMPSHITVVKERSSKYYRVNGYHYEVSEVA